MKIFIPAGLFYPSKLGGPANTLFWLAKALHSKGVDVTVVTSNNHIDDNSIEFDKWTLVDDIRVRYCTAKSKFPLRIIYFSIKELLKCDVVLLSSFFYKPNIVFALISRILKRKIFWSPRGELFDSALKGSKIKRIYIKIIKSLFSKNVIFHATSLDERDSLIKHLGYNIKTVVIPNLMELPVKRDRIREEKYFLYVGRIAPIKAIDILILGLSKSESFMHSEYKLLIAGDVQNQFKGYNEQIQLILKNESLKEKVVFLGNVQGEEKYRLYANAYFTLLVSHSENFGNVVIESLSQGTPVIASQGTPWQKLEDKNAGFWINNSIEDIANCVDAVNKIGYEEYQKIRDNAYNYGLEFDVHTNIDKWINVIK